jgi:hypothetical protein
MQKIVKEKDRKIVVRFDGFNDLGDHVRGKGNGSSDKKFDRAFHRSTKNLAEAVAQTVSGWDEPFDRIESIRENVRERIGYIDTKVMRFDNAMYGQFLDVDTYMTGDPNCMLQVFEDESKRAQRFVRILVDTSYSSGVPPKEIETRGGAIVALCDALNTCGYSTEVWAVANIKGYESGSELAILVPVQLQNAPWDVRSASFPLANGDHLRRNVFAVMEQLSPAERKVFDVGDNGNYGYPLPSRKGGLSDLYCGGADIICTNDIGDLRHITSDPVKWVLNQCKNLGVISQDETI